jgi:hypothetical protein
MTGTQITATALAVAEKTPPDDLQVSCAHLKKILRGLFFFHWKVLAVQWKISDF